MELAKPHINPKRSAYVIKDYKVNKRAMQILKEAIENSGVNVHDKYDLFKLTNTLGEMCIQSSLEHYNIGTTTAIVKAIQHMVDTNEI
jgi:hypothetical protein